MKRFNSVRPISTILRILALLLVLLLAGNVAGTFLRDAGQNATQAGQYKKGLYILQLASYLAPINAQVWRTRCDAFDGQEHPDDIPAEIRS